MGVKDVLVHLWVLSAAVQIRQASTGLSVSPKVTAACGDSVTLHCNVSSDQGEMTVMHMSWLKNNKTLCKINPLTNEQPTSDIECRYANKSLSVTFLQTSQQQESSLDEYLCKLRSNQGHDSKKTSVELKECIQRVYQNVTAEGPRCSFAGVRRDGEVHWHQGETRLTETDAAFQKTESVDKECCLTIIGSLRPKDPTGPYTCSLWDSQSQSYTTRRTFPHYKNYYEKQTNSTGGSGVLRAQWSIGSCFIISALLML